jgi:hypothetical protein
MEIEEPSLRRAYRKGLERGETEPVVLAMLNNATVTPT